MFQVPMSSPQMTSTFGLFWAGRVPAVPTRKPPVTTAATTHCQWLNRRNMLILLKLEEEDTGALQNGQTHKLIRWQLRKPESHRTMDTLLQRKLPRTACEPGLLRA